MRLSDAIKDKLMDIRVKDKLLADGKITKEDVETYYKNLPDMESEATFYDLFEDKRRVATNNQNLS